VVVTHEQLDLFADATGDHRSVHSGEPSGEPATSAEPRGRVEVLSDRMAPGYLTLALSNLFLPQIVEVRGVSLGVNYGMEKVRFPSPVPVGSRLRGGAELLDVADIAGGVQTTMRVTVELDGSAEPACVIDSLSRYLA
jgi:acyl dehydratase